jgi:glycosyltransferase involved in cell wall biosynthesis
VDISVVIPTTDRAIFLGEALASIRVPKGAVAEIIVVHDGAASFLAPFASRYPMLRVLAGRDRGPTDADNLGLAAARGTYIVFLSSDDRLRPETLESLFAAGNRRPEVGIWSGGARFFRSDAFGTEVVIGTVYKRDAIALSLPNILDGLPLWNARFYRRDVFDRIGPLDDRFAELSDRELLVRAIVAGVNEAALDAVVYEYRMHEASRTLDRAQRRILLYLEGHVALARRWASDPRAPEAVREIFRAWHGRETARLIYHQLLRGRAVDAVRTSIRESRHLPGWWMRAPSAIPAARRRNRLVIPEPN